MRPIVIARTAMAAAAFSLGACSDLPAPETAQGCGYAVDTSTFKVAYRTLPQNWDCAEREAFWFTDQGSQIVPYAWFVNLEQADGQAKFADPANMDRYRYLPMAKSDLNPDGLPIGFTKGAANANPAYGKIASDWLGLNCSACHTNRVDYGGVAYLIDGAPAMSDFENMMRDMVAALKATTADPAKFARFADAVLGVDRQFAEVRAGAEAVLTRQMQQVIAIRDDWNKRNESTHAGGDYGFARLDAIGAINNEIVVTLGGPAQDLRPANAPVSYPFIWDTPQHDLVEWNGSVSNRGLGVVSRNTGEVVGVFGSLTRSPPATSIDFGALAKLESLMKTLWSPEWTATGLPRIDATLAAQGKVIFDAKCAGCHKPIVRDDPQRKIVATLIPIKGENGVGTDPTMAENARFWVETQNYGPGKGVPLAIAAGLLQSPASAQAAVQAMVAGQSPEVQQFIGAEAQKFFQDVGQMTDPRAVQQRLGQFLGGIDQKFPRTPPPAACNAAKFPLGPLCYKARSLNGIWATAPFLHNGSVPTLRQLLLPADMRAKTFRVGSRTFDPKNIGFVDDGSGDGFLFDTGKPGNSNAGHDSVSRGNAEFAEHPERLDALLEYLKTL